MMQDSNGTNLYECCRLCPRECGVNRLQGQKGRCGTDSRMRAARAALHMWEEPCISGTEGSGTVFFSGCSLGCVYCQNHDISSGGAGKIVTVERLAEMFLELQVKGANNINLVTAEHFLPSVILSLKLAKRRGLAIPVVYNTSGYEKVETLALLDGLVDIYLPDFKYMDPKVAARYSDAPDYPEYAKAALTEMVRQTGEAEFDERGYMKRGVIVRYLLLPGQGKDARRVIRYLHDTYGDTIFLSIMSQYTPVTDLHLYPEIMRRVTKREYEKLIAYALDIGVENGFMQEGETAKESFIPPFDYEGI